MLVHRSLQVSARSVRPRTNAVTCSAGNGPSTSQSEQQILSRRQLLSTLGAGVAAFGFVRRVDAAQSRIADLLAPLGAPLDSNGDGILDVDELRAAVSAAGGPPSARETIRNELIPVVDFDRDGRVSVDEFVRGLSLEVPLDDTVWAIMDKDGNGGVSLAELRGALGDLGGKRGDTVISAAFELSGGDIKSVDARLTRSQAEKAMDFIATGILGDLIGEQ